MAATVACIVLTGCASMHVHDVQPDTPQLPPAAVERSSQTVAVYFSEPFRTAHPEHAISFLGETQTWRHALGDASVGTFRQALAAVFTDVVELAEPPDATAMPPGVSAVIVPQPPAVHGQLTENAVVALYRQSVVYPVKWLVPGASSPTQGTVEGIATTGARGVGFMSQKTLDESMLRSAGAALIVALSRMSSTGDTAPTATVEPAAPPDASGVVALRLDAGIARDDGIERRVGECLARAVAAPAALAGEQAAAGLRDALFPWLDPGVAPTDADGVRALLGRPTVRARLAALGVGRLVLLTARDVEGREKNRMYCAGGFNAGACFGLYESRTGYAVDLAVWDVARRELLGTNRAEVTQTLGALGVLLPIPFFSSTATEACTQMQRYVRGALQP